MDASSLSKAISQIFLLDYAQFHENVPHYWRNFVVKEFKSDKTSSQTPPKKSSNDSVENDDYLETLSNDEIVYPEAISQILPAYTSVARNMRATGIVLLKAIIEKEGNVTVKDVITPLGLGLDENAVEAVSKWNFSPALLNNEPIRLLVYIEVEYSIKKD